MTKELIAKEQETEAKRKVDVELAHQKDEAETQNLARKMMSDVKKNKPTFNALCCNLLNNFQGIFFFFFLKTVFILFFSNRFLEKH